MYLIYTFNIFQVVLWMIIPGFVPSTIIAFCGVVMYFLNAWVEWQIDRNNIGLEDLL